MNEKLGEFYAKLMADENLKSKLKNILDGANITSATDDQLKEIVEIAKDLDYNFTLAEIKNFITSGDVQLSEDDLEAVAGGVNKDSRIIEGEKNIPENRQTF